MDENLFYCPVRRPFSLNVASLQNIVLRAITINFEKYMREYKSPDSHVPKYFFEFLRKFTFLQEIIFLSASIKLYQNRRKKKCIFLKHTEIVLIAEKKTFRVRI